MRNIHDPTEPTANYRRAQGSAFVAALAPQLSRNTPEFREMADRAADSLDDGTGAAAMAELLGYDESLVRSVYLLRAAPRPNG